MRSHSGADCGLALVVPIFAGVLVGCLMGHVAFGAGIGLMLGSLFTLGMCRRAARSHKPPTALQDNSWPESAAQYRHLGESEAAMAWVIYSDHRGGMPAPYFHFHTQSEATETAQRLRAAIRRNGQDCHLTVRWQKDPPATRCAE